MSGSLGWLEAGRPLVFGKPLPYLLLLAFVAALFVRTGVFCVWWVSPTVATRQWTFSSHAESLATGCAAPTNSRPCV